MSAQLKSLVTFPQVPVGESRQLPHNLRSNSGLSLVPDVLLPNIAGAAQLTADDVNVTVVNVSNVPLSIQVLCEAWHSFERAFGAQQITKLDPQPFIGAQNAYTPTGSNAFDLINGDSIALVPGMPIALITGGAVVRTDATDHSRATSIGLILHGNDPTLLVDVQPDGNLELTTDQWDAVTGQVGGLTAGATYYVAPTPGMLTTTPPSIPGSTVQAIGRALYVDEMLILLAPPIYL